MSVAAIVLDNEAVQALLGPDHPKHPRVVALLTEASRRNLRRAGRVLVVVPTAVRVEAGWDRTDPSGAHANHLARPRDHPLSSTAVDRATQLRGLAQVSVVDACVAEAAEAAPQPAVIVTSDEKDMRRLTGYLADATHVRVVAI